jgi:ferric-dicitrate binding protein FerR (iron transport regulator)
MKKDYTTVEDFAADESFQNYCLHKSSKESDTWIKYSKKNLEKKGIMEEAKSMILLFSSPEALVVQSTSVSTNHRKYWAAGIFILLTAVLGSYMLWQQKKVESTIAYVTYRALQEQEFISLPDQSTIQLREGATLRVSEPWTANQREVWLEGEAFFDIMKTNNKKKEKFTVHLSSGDIAVLGTSFLVKESPEKTKIILVEGSIKFTNDDENFLLQPDDVLSIDKEMSYIKHKQDVAEYTTWKESNLTFKSKSIDDILSVLKNSYGLIVKLGSKKLKNRKITTSIAKNDPQLLLQAIAEIYNVEIIKKEGFIILK